LREIFVMKDKPKVLILDDEPNILKTMGICFDDLGFDTKRYQDPKEVMELIKNTYFDLAFVDLKMTPIDGIQILEEIKKNTPETTVVIITAHGTVESAVEAIKKGAYDYLQKPFDFVELQIFAEKVLEYHNLKQEVKVLREEKEKSAATGNIITQNPKMKEMIELAERIAETDLSVLIEGESGTGKELYAQFIYEKSNRADKPFVKVNCAALPENLLESELFGHIKGAFTGAIKNRQGRFEMADGGTIFLDEIAELTPTLQAKLLRVLHQKEFERVGESITRQVDVRILAATNHNLEAAIEEGTFRQDLFYRLNAVRIKLVPLRERPEDVLLLTQHFIKKYSPNTEIKISNEVEKLLQLYRWSGNVRELENVIHRAVLLAKNNCIEISDLPEEICSSMAANVENLSLEEVEKNHIKKTIQLTKDLGETAQILGIDPATLWRKRKKYNL
jgi:NtrC-family two-component system response regulator AlgB